jgi:hypothetical protein
MVFIVVRRMVEKVKLLKQVTSNKVVILIVFQ